MREAIVLAGGFGTRLRSVVSDLPKPMAPVNGRPFLSYILDHLAGQGFRHVVLSTGHLHEKVSERFGEAYGALRLSYAVEATPLGTGGGILNALRQCDGDEVAVLNGDTLFPIDFARAERTFHDQGADLLVALRHVEDASRYGSVALQPNGRIAAFVEKDAAQGAGLVNGGIYLLRRSLLGACGFGDLRKFSFEKDLMEPFAARMPFFGMVSDAYFIDIGIPEDYRRAQAELA